MKASEEMKAVKQWFKLSNYDVLQELTISCVIHRHRFNFLSSSL